VINIILQKLIGFPMQVVYMDEVLEVLQDTLEFQQTVALPLNIELYNSFAILGIISCSVLIALLILKGVS